MSSFNFPVHHRPMRDSSETASKLRRVGEFLLAITFSTFGALIQAHEGRGTSSSSTHLVLLFDLSFLAIVLSLASSALHLELHRRLRLPLARLFLRLAAFFTTTAVVLLITSSISPSLRWVPFMVFFSTFLFLVCITLFPATLHYVAALRRCMFVVSRIGPAADDDEQLPSYQSATSMSRQRRHGESETPPLPELRLRMARLVRREQRQRHRLPNWGTESENTTTSGAADDHEQLPSYQSTSTFMPGQRRHGESGTPPLPELRLSISLRSDQRQWYRFPPPTDHITLDIEALVRTVKIHTSNSD